MSWLNPSIFQPNDEQDILGHHQWAQEGVFSRGNVASPFFPWAAGNSFQPSPAFVLLPHASPPSPYVTGPMQCAFPIPGINQCGCGMLTHPAAVPVPLGAIPSAHLPRGRQQQSRTAPLHVSQSRQAIQAHLQHQRQAAQLSFNAADRSGSSADISYRQAPGGNGVVVNGGIFFQEDDFSVKFSLIIPPNVKVEELSINVEYNEIIVATKTDAADGDDNDERNRDLNNDGNDNNNNNEDNGNEQHDINEGSANARLSSSSFSRIIPLGAGAGLLDAPRVQARFFPTTRVLIITGHKLERPEPIQIPIVVAAPGGGLHRAGIRGAPAAGGGGGVNPNNQNRVRAGAASNMIVEEDNEAFRGENGENSLQEENQPGAD